MPCGKESRLRWHRFTFGVRGEGGLAEVKWRTLALQGTPLLCQRTASGIYQYVKTFQPPPEAVLGK